MAWMPGIIGSTAVYSPGQYYLFQMPRWDRRLRIVLDWTVALFFRRDIAELSLLGHPRRLGE